MKTSLLLVLLASSAHAAPAQDPVRDPAVDQAAPTPQPAGTPEALETWARLESASTGGVRQDPITAFRLRAELRLREGVQSNDLDSFEVSYLAPDCIRFLLDRSSETGRFGRKAREHWVRTKEGVTTLAGRDYAPDRKQIQEMHAIARNFVALSSPALLRVEKLELLPAPPADLSEVLQRGADRMPWLRVTSPDFALFTDQVSLQGGTPETAPRFVVDIGLHRRGKAEDLPRYAIIRELPSEGRVPGRPMLIQLDRYEETSGFRIPKRILVHALGRGVDARFADTPSQEVDVLEADLRAPLTVDDFKPEG